MTVPPISGDETVWEAMSGLNLEQIRAFLAVVRLGGVRRAAQALNLSQPAVTTRIRRLEETLSQVLFDRSGARMTLTREGERFLGYAEKFEHLADMVERKVVDPKAVDGWLRIGASETVTQCWLPDFVARLRQEFPKVQVELHVDISSNLRDALLAREIDLALLLGPVSDFAVDNVALPDFRLAWYAATDLPLPPEGPAGYLKHPVISYARNTRPYRELKAELLERVGPTASIFPSSSLSAAFRLVEAGLGVAALPEAMGRPLVARGVLQDFDPGWTPSPLFFTASSVAEPQSHLIEVATSLALDVARTFAGDK
ncbi:LysR family transcriptional regulator [Tropicimonas sp. S265A]|uniref:LysR family transcriptional regulator n=1 Tax=Tropicimonas sp. S265A TaxID=3415134 RepID=UPI003C7D06B5